MIGVIGAAGNGSRELVRQLLAEGAATSRLAHLASSRISTMLCGHAEGDRQSP
jgi:hypothetical protein